MKTIEEIKNQEPIFMHDFECREQVLVDFSHEGYWHGHADSDYTPILKRYEGVNVLFASYVYAECDGDAFVLFEQDGKLYTVYGSHCSCYGLEGQWDPEETEVEELAHLLSEGTLGNYYNGNVYRDELREFIGMTFH